MNRRRGPRTPEEEIARYTGARRGLYISAPLFFAFGLYFAVLAIHSVLDEQLRRSPDTQTITAIATSNVKDCNKSGCYFDAYGYYTINGQLQQDRKVAQLSEQEMHGEIGILVNPSRPDFPMPLTYDPYISQAIVSALCSFFFLLYPLFLFFLLRLRNKKLQERLHTSV